MPPVSPIWHSNAKKIHVQLDFEANVMLASLSRTFNFIMQQLEGRIVKNYRLSAFLLSNSVCTFQSFSWAFSPLNETGINFSCILCSPIVIFSSDVSNPSYPFHRFYYHTYLLSVCIKAFMFTLHLCCLLYN